MTGVATWMPWYIGDWHRDTSHLSADQRGVYKDLIDAAWLRDGLLPADDAQLCRLGRADSPAHWRRIRETVMSFFLPVDGGWRHKRVELELEKAKAGYGKRAGKAKMAAEARWAKHAPSNAPSMPGAVLETMHVDAQPQPQPQPQSLRDINRSPSAHSPGKPGNGKPPNDKYPKDFQEFWLAYPRKEGKGSALKAWKTALKLATPATIIASLERHWSLDTTKIPHPATFLNARRWLDEIAPQINGVDDFLKGMTE